MSGSHRQCHNCTLCLLSSLLQIPWGKESPLSVQCWHVNVTPLRVFCIVVFFGNILCILCDYTSNASTHVYSNTEGPLIQLKRNVTVKVLLYITCLMATIFPTGALLNFCSSNMFITLHWTVYSCMRQLAIFPFSSFGPWHKAHRQPWHLQWLMNSFGIYTNSAEEVFHRDLWSFNTQNISNIFWAYAMAKALHPEVTRRISWAPSLCAT